MSTSFQANRRLRWFAFGNGLLGLAVGASFLDLAHLGGWGAAGVLAMWWGAYWMGIGSEATHEYTYGCAGRRRRARQPPVLRKRLDVGLPREGRPCRWSGR